MKGLLCALGTCLVVAQTFAGLPLPGEQGGVWTDMNGARKTEMKTPETSRLFTRWVDPDSGVVSYMLKEGVVGKWNQQVLYFIARSMTDDGRFLVFDVSDDERAHPVENGVDSAITKAVIDFQKDEAFLLEGTDGCVPFFDAQTAKLYYCKHDPATTNAFYSAQGEQFGDMVPAVFMRDLRADPFREVKLCDVPDDVKGGGTNVFTYFTNLTLTKDRRKAFLEVATDIDLKTWKGIHVQGLLDLETGRYEKWGRTDFYCSHGQVNPLDETVALCAHECCWQGLPAGAVYPRLRLLRADGEVRTVTPPFRNFATHECWAPDGLGFTYGSHGCMYYELKTGRHEVLCPLRCGHPTVDRSGRYVLVDAGVEDWWRGCPWRVAIWDRCTGRKVDIFTRSGELCPKLPKSRQSQLHPDAHPAFACNDRYVVSTFNADRRMTLCVTPLQPLKDRLDATTDETDVWDLSETCVWIDREAANDYEQTLALWRLRDFLLMRSGVPAHESGRCFVIGVPPPGGRAAEEGEGCVKIWGGKAWFWGDCQAAVRLFIARVGPGRKVVLRDGTFWTTRHPESKTLFLVGDSTLDDYWGLRPHAASWGASLSRRLKEGVFAVNCARSGASTVSFKRSGRWDQMVSTIRPQDKVIIQFGHNERDLSEYGRLLAEFAADVRKKGGEPVFVTPIARATFDKATGRTRDDKCADGWGLEECRDRMLDLGARLGVETVDLHRLTRRHLDAVGEAAARAYFRCGTPAVDKFGRPLASDVTHPCPRGADKFAELFLEEIAKRPSGLADFLCR